MSLTEDKTNLEHFNHYLREFLNQLLLVFPEARTKLELTYHELLKDSKSKNDTYVKHFMKRARPLANQLKDKDETMFSRSLALIDGIDLGEMWRDQKLSVNSRKSIWKYLTLLYVIGGTVVSIPNQLEKKIKDFETYGEQGAPVDAQAEALQQMLNNLKEKNELGADEEDKESGGFDMSSLLSGAAGAAGGLNLDGLLGENNFLSGLMNDIKDEFKDVEMPENPTDLGSVFQSFSNPETQAKMQNIFGKMAQRFEEGSKNGDFNPEQMQRQAEQMMNTMGINQEQLQQQAAQMGMNQSQMNRLRSTTRDQAARARLQKKLEAKRQKQQEK